VGVFPELQSGRKIDVLVRLSPSRCCALLLALAAVFAADLEFLPQDRSCGGWYKAVVLERRGPCVLIHYLGWDNRCRLRSLQQRLRILLIKRLLLFCRQRG
jgi:hypothetical protein